MVGMSATPITFVDAVAQGFRKATDFRGRSNRREYWFWVLFTVIVQLVTTTADAFIYPQDVTAQVDPNDIEALMSQLETQVQHSLWSISTAVTLLLLLPTVAATVRRFRDAGWKPWLAGVSYCAVYGGLFASLAMSASVLAVLTKTGADVSDAALNTALGALGFSLLFLALELAGAVTLLVGALQRTKPELPTE
ncbi:MAG: hypothetical protein RLZ72_762 [Actinomycetota bacterium]|jgi:uncharacterized membrane protein YhaH (DUF805 family)